MTAAPGKPVRAAAANVPDPGHEAPALRLDGVAKSYGGRAVLRDVALTLHAGEAVAVLGPNGSGKSTLLRLAAALSPADAGAVRVAGHAAGRDDHAVRRAVAYVGQEPALYAEMTPLEHVRLWMRLLGGPGGDAAAVLADAGLAAASGRPCGQLSRGQRQRLALALALLRGPHGPDVLVLDEPFTALDADGDAWLAARLAARRAEGAALLVAVHDERQAGLLGARRLRVRRHRLEEAAA